MTRLSPDERCGGCGSPVWPPSLAFDVIVPSAADYVCLKCRRAYRWVGNPPRLMPLIPFDRSDEPSRDR